MYVHRQRFYDFLGETPARDCADQKKLLDLSWHPKQQQTLKALDIR
jgi:hypothetical protein